MSSQDLTAGNNGAASAEAAEQNASAPASVSASSGSAPGSAAPAPNLRSCVVCRTRKVRCDKQSPCSNCQRASVACVFPSAIRQPRWAQRLDKFSGGSGNLRTIQHADPNVDKVMNRLRTLESLVKELRGQLEHANARPTEVYTPYTAGRSNEAQQAAVAADGIENVDEYFGRMILQDGKQSRYISSGFWSRIDDELSGLKTETEGMADEDQSSSEDESMMTPGTTTAESSHRPASDRHAFLLRHKFAPPIPDLREYHPLPSQVPFLVEVFTENVNLLVRIVHSPSITSMVRVMRLNSAKPLSPSDEALMFSIYYAATVSMENDDVMANFGMAKSDLTLKYRIGLEHALAKADFLNAPNMTLVQAFALFLFVARRHDSPRYVWMMTGLVIRMGQYLGLQRDGAHFDYLSPFEIEMRRRVWWCLCMLDVRSSEDQGTDLMIGTFDTKVPSNLDEGDIDPKLKTAPKPRQGLTDLSLARMLAGQIETNRQMMKHGFANQTDLSEKSRLLQVMFSAFEQEYLQHTAGSGSILNWIATIVARIVMAKMTLIVFLPVLTSPPAQSAASNSSESNQENGEQQNEVSQTIRTKLLIAAIEVAEYNHLLNATQAARQWRWVYQTYTHWHSIVYLLIEISRRPWSATIERAWTALHSPWLIPKKERDMRVWVPIGKLMLKARRHREMEYRRLKNDPAAAAALEKVDGDLPLPGSTVPSETQADSTPESTAALFRRKWRDSIRDAPEPQIHVSPATQTPDGPPAPQLQSQYQSQSQSPPIPARTADPNTSWPSNPPPIPHLQQPPHPSSSLSQPPSLHPPPYPPPPFFSPQPPLPPSQIYPFPPPFTSTPLFPGSQIRTLDNPYNPHNPSTQPHQTPANSHLYTQNANLGGHTPHMSESQATDTDTGLYFDAGNDVELDIEVDVADVDWRAWFAQVQANEMEMQGMMEGGW